MKKITILLVLIFFWTAQLVWADAKNPKVSMETSLGTIVLELDPKAAPKTVENFLRYVNEGFFAGTIFHRVIKGFMIQGGGLSSEMVKKPTHDPTRNEADNGLKNIRGTIAMARTNNPHSATAQFFINTVDNASLDYRGKNQRGWGYCVFGKVVEGMAVVDSIENLPTSSKGGRRNVPVSPPVIIRATVKEEKK